MAKMGRPTSNPRTVNIQFRLSEAEAQLLKSCADRMNCNRIDIIISGISMVDEKLKKEGK